MIQLLFSPSGKIGRQTFHKGAVILLAINFFAWLAWYGGLGLGFFTAFLSLILIYCWGCLYVKRLRDAGKPGALFLPVLLAFIILSYFLANMLAAILVPEIVQEAIELQEVTDPRNPDLDVVLPVYNRLMKGIAIPYAAAYFIIGALLAFTTNARWPTGDGSR